MSQSHAHDHGHDHDHDHDPPDRDQRQRAQGPAVLFLIFGFMVVEAVGGDAVGLAGLAGRRGPHADRRRGARTGLRSIPVRPPRGDSKRTFGYLRFEVIAGFLNAVTLFAIVAWIAYEAWGGCRRRP